MNNTKAASALNPPGLAGSAWVAGCHLETRLHPSGSPDELVKALNRVEDFKGVELQRCDFDQI